MFKIKYIIIILFASQFCLSQTAQDSIVFHDRYFEDQFYLGLTYNLLVNSPEDLTQRNLSYGLQAGFIKDIPLNRNRTFALGLGVGYAVNSNYTNLIATKENNSISYDFIADSDDVTKRSKIETHLIEFPIEFRWRNSNPSSYKFWRIYSGVKLAYVLGARSKVVAAEKTSFALSDVNPFQYGLTLNVGYNTFNIHVYYGLNQIFENGVTITNGDAILFKPLRVGFVFYIL